MSEPWMKFYPRDWRGDQALRAVSIAARGFWMECLCIMHEAKPYGHLVLNGEPVEGDTLARMTGTSVDEVSALMSELRQAGVLSVTSKGVVFSRRMTKDHARAGKGRKAAQKRWAQTSDNKSKSGGPNGLPNRSPITQKPETRSQNAASQQRASGFLYDRLLEAASSRGPCHPNLALGFSQISDLVAKGYDPDRDILPVIAEKAKPDISSWSYYVKIIVQRAEERRAIPEKTVKQIDWAGRLRGFADDGFWPQAWGPRPGDPGCEAPPDLLEQARASA